MDVQRIAAEEDYTSRGKSYAFCRLVATLRDLFALRPQGHIREGILPVLHGAQQWREDIPQKVTELPRVPGKIPSFQATVESHPNVEKHDVRMGHPARRGEDRP
jgi:hypothetical protein